MVRKQITDYTFEHNFKDGYPIIGLKQTYPKMAFNEMLAFMRGYTNLKQLEELGVNFWRKDAYNYLKRVTGGEVPFEEFLRGSLVGVCYDGPYFEWGDLGKIYSHQIRNWNGEVDQLNQVLERLKKTPFATKNVVTMWNPSDMEECALSPCHRSFEFVVRPLDVYERQEWFEDNHRTDVEWYYNNVKQSTKDEYFNSKNIPKFALKVVWEQSAVDTFLGLPINILYYSDVCYTFAHYLNMKPEGIKGNLTNVHLYDNSLDAVEELLSRDILSIEHPVKVITDFPKSWENLDDYLNQLEYGKSFKVEKYSHLGRLDVEMLAYSK